MATSPITPSDIGHAAKQGQRFPAEVFAAFNELMVKHWDGNAASFTQDAVLSNILARLPSTQRHEVFENRWLDVEESYRGAGWDVEYEKPGYNESGSARFTFKRRTR